MDNGEEALKHVDEESFEVLPDFPPGPLDNYRKQATFPWKKLRLFVEDEELLKFKVIFKSVLFELCLLLNLIFVGPSAFHMENHGSRSSFPQIKSFHEHR
jgi:hypothetical protein